MIQYFVSVSRESFLHSLGHERKSSMGHGMSAYGGEADVIRRKADIPVSLPSSPTNGKTFSAKGPKFSARIWKNISVRTPDSKATRDLVKFSG